MSDQEDLARVGLGMTQPRQRLLDHGSQLVVRADVLLLLPRFGDRPAALAHRLERSLDVGQHRSAFVGSTRDDVRCCGADVRGVPGRDDRAEGMAEQREAPYPERLGEQVDVAREDVEREGRGVDPIAPALAALVHVEQAELVSERVEPGSEHRVVHPRPAVEDDHR